MWAVRELAQERQPLSPIWLSGEENPSEAATQNYRGSPELLVDLLVFCSAFPDGSWITYSALCIQSTTLPRGACADWISVIDLSAW